LKNLPEKRKSKKKNLIRTVRKNNYSSSKNTKTKTIQFPRKTNKQTNKHITLLLFFARSFMIFHEG